MQLANLIVAIFSAVMLLNIAVAAPLYDNLPTLSRYGRSGVVGLLRLRRQADGTASGSVLQPWGGDLPLFSNVGYYGGYNQNSVNTVYPSNAYNGFYGKK